MLSILSATVGEVFAYIGYVLLALLALMVMIVVHELGHYTAGKLLGFKIDEFAIGFGPKIFKKKNKKTGELFSIRPFPVGGFCAFHGEDADGALLDEDGNQIKDANGNIVKDPDAFNNQKPWKRLIVLFSGAFMNFLSAILIITIYFTAYGQPLPYVVGTYDVPSYENVFMEGDAILSVNGKQINLMTTEDLDKAFGNVGDNAKFYVLRDGKRIKINASKFYYNPFADGDFIYAVNGDKLETPVPYDEYLATCDSTDAILFTVVRYDEKRQYMRAKHDESAKRRKSRRRRRFLQLRLRHNSHDCKSKTSVFPCFRQGVEFLFLHRVQDLGVARRIDHGQNGHRRCRRHNHHNHHHGKGVCARFRFVPIRRCDNFRKPGGYEPVAVPGT